jgi:predicted RNase H-like HicB family nuclease
MAESEIIFEVREDEADGGYTARALGHSIFTEGDSLEELRRNVREAADCYFEDETSAPRIIRLHFVRDEVLSR